METIEDIIRRIVRDELRQAERPCSPTSADETPQTRWLTAGEAAAIAHRNGYTVRRALQDGTLHGRQRKKGGTWLLTRQCVDAWIFGVPCPHNLGSAET
jgi:hypothetical protein